MTKTEFIDRLKTMGTEYITDDMYADIEFVYTRHPCIDEVVGKDQIAKLFDMFGYRIIKDMLPTAQKAKELSEEITKKENELQELRWEFNRLRR